MSNNNQVKPAAQIKNSSSTSNWLVGLISFVAIFSAGGGIGLGYYAWLELNKRLDIATVDRQSISHDIETIDENSRLQSFKSQIQHNIEEFEPQLIELSKQIEQQAVLQEKISESNLETITYVNRSQLNWGLKESEHVLRMASHRLHIEGDVIGTIAALNAADLRLEELNDIRLNPVRDSISIQIGKLKNFPYPDWVGISLQIDNILVGLRRDLINETQQQSKTQTKNSVMKEHDSDLPWWKRLANSIRNSINNSVKVTHDEQSMKLFIAQQEKQRDYEFLRMKLLGAKYSAVGKDDESYHRELGSALAWLKNNKSITNNEELAHDFQELNSINLEPELPDITEPFVLLGSTIEAIENR